MCWILVTILLGVKLAGLLLIESYNRALVRPRRRSLRISSKLRPRCKLRMATIRRRNSSALVPGRVLVRTVIPVPCMVDSLQDRVARWARQARGCKVRRRWVLRSRVEFLLSSNSSRDLRALSSNRPSKLLRPLHNSSRPPDRRTALPLMLRLDQPLFARDRNPVLRVTPPARMRRRLRPRPWRMVLLRLFRRLRTSRNPRVPRLRLALFLLVLRLVVESFRRSR